MRLEFLTVAAATVFGFWVGSASASLIIIPNGGVPDDAHPESQSGAIGGGFGFPCTGCTAAAQAPDAGFPVTTIGYSISWSPNPPALLCLVRACLALCSSDVVGMSDS